MNAVAPIPAPVPTPLKRQSANLAFVAAIEFAVGTTKRPVRIR